jgi:hypothetical protein
MVYPRNHGHEKNSENVFGYVVPVICMWNAKVFMLVSIDAETGALRLPVFLHWALSLYPLGSKKGLWLGKRLLATIASSKG